MALIGYARVSTGGQDTALQLDALGHAGVVRIFEDSSSGVGARPRLRDALSALRLGDVLVVWKIDRVARSLSDLLNILDRVRLSGASMKSLTEPIDTSSSIGEFTIQILGAVAQLERNLIRERTIAGQVAALKRGVKLGRHTHAIGEPTISEMRLLHSSGEHTYPSIAAIYSVHPSTVKRLVTGRSSRKKLPVLSQYL